MTNEFQDIIRIAYMEIDDSLLLAFRLRDSFIYSNGIFKEVRIRVPHQYYGDRAYI